jgi:molecular chaperone GrpE
MEERNEQTVEEMTEQSPEEITASQETTEEASAEDVQLEDAAALQEKVNALQAKLADTENRLLRLQADFDNYRRRSLLEREAAEKYRAQSLVLDILPALDNFERAMKVEAKDEQTSSLLQGMEMVYRQLLEALTKEGVEVIEAVGQPFDPHYHQAVMQVEDSQFESNTVVEEFQKGYKLKDRVIRPSMVKVSQ